MVLGGPRCGVHVRTQNKVGPNQIRRDELKYIHQMNTRNIYSTLSIQGIETQVELNRIFRERQTAIREEGIRYQLAKHMLEITINQETDANGGIDADEPAIERNNAARRARDEARRELWARRDAIRAQRRAAFRQAPNGARHIHPDGELANLANDRQNIHTAVVVAKVKENIEKVLQILVPPEYQTDTIKTPGEIILECKLSKQAAWQMMAKYCADEDIYDLGVGIYPRVLNSVWQFIKASPHAEDLKKILASEMEDNIGMCAQGNLSRICNILSGYLDGINDEIKSRNQILGELLAPLMDIDNTHDRLKQAIRILKEHNVPVDERDTWLEPLGDNVDVPAAQQAVAIDV